MSASGRFATVADFIPDQHVVAGTVLKPFCLGHHLLFVKLGLPFAGRYDAPAEFWEIIFGVAVCANSYSDTLDSLYAGKWADEIKRWRRKALGSPLTQLFRRPRFSECDVETSFREYLRTGYEMPPLWRRGSGGASLSAPWESLLQVRLSSCGFTESQILEGYLPRLWYHYFCAIESAALDRCDSEGIKHWKPIFFTESDAARMQGL